MMDDHTMDLGRAVRTLCYQLRDNGIEPDEEALDAYREAFGPLPGDEPCHPKDQLSRETREHGALVSGERHDDPMTED